MVRPLQFVNYLGHTLGARPLQFVSMPKKLQPAPIGHAVPQKLVKNCRMCGGAPIRNKRRRSRKRR